MAAFATVKTRRRAPSNGVSIPELASTAPVTPILAGLRTVMCALQRTSGAKLSLSAAVPRGLALLADVPHGDLRRFSMKVTGPASPWRPRV